MARNNMGRCLAKRLIASAVRKLNRQSGAGDLFAFAGVMLADVGQGKSTWWSPIYGSGARVRCVARSWPRCCWMVLLGVSRIWRNLHLNLSPHRTCSRRRRQRIPRANGWNLALLSTFRGLEDSWVRVRESIAVTVAWPLAGCGGWQSALDAHGSAAADIKHLFFVFLAVAAAVWITVLCVLLAALIRGRQPRPDPLEVDQAGERRAGHVIFGCAVATTLIVLVLSVLSYISQSTVFAKSRPAVNIEIVGHQWWWEVKYDGASPDERFTTANEIRVPIGVPVRARLETQDVIHSFWVPSLFGKMDLINGQTNEIEFEARSACVYRGQCAEFCGLQHALMALEVIALPKDQYETWRSQQIASPGVADDPTLARGDLAFRSQGCALCHTIRGTVAGGKLGPDLTHLGSRRTIAAGTLPMTPGNLAAWIADPQHIKPGNYMRTVLPSASDLNALVAYLGALK